MYICIRPIKFSGTQLDEKTMIKIGDICPVFFNPVKNRFQQDVDYIQRFYTTDNLLIQIFSDGSDIPNLILKDLIKGDSKSITLISYLVNDAVMMYYTTLSRLSDSVYSIVVGGKESEPFEFCSDISILEDTSLIRYSHKDNNSTFDNIFWIDNTQQIFEFRVECGFKPSGYSPKVNVEQYRNQEQEIETLYAVPYDSYTLSVGDSSGVPYWFGKHINRILCLSMVEISGEKYVRSESSTPDLSPVSEDGQMFYISVNLEPQKNDIAGMGGAKEISNAQSLFMPIINNPKDGEVLVYNEEKSVFVNDNTI